MDTAGQNCNARDVMRGRVHSLRSLHAFIRQCCNSGVTSTRSLFRALHLLCIVKLNWLISTSSSSWLGRWALLCSALIIGIYSCPMHPPDVGQLYNLEQRTEAALYGQINMPWTEEEEAVCVNINSWRMLHVKVTKSNNLRIPFAYKTRMQTHTLLHKYNDSN